MNKITYDFNKLLVHKKQDIKLFKDTIKEEIIDWIRIPEMLFSITKDASFSPIPFVWLSAPKMKSPRAFSPCNSKE